MSNFDRNLLNLILYFWLRTQNQTLKGSVLGHIFHIKNVPSKYLHNLFT
jgi:hypothetical protein